MATLTGFEFEILFEDGDRWRGKLWGSGGLLGDEILYRWPDWERKNKGRVPVDWMSHLRKRAQADLDALDARGHCPKDRKPFAFYQKGIVVDVHAIIEGD